MSVWSFLVVFGHHSSFSVVIIVQFFGIFSSFATFHFHLYLLFSYFLHVCGMSTNCTWRKVQILLWFEGRVPSLCLQLSMHPGYLEEGISLWLNGSCALVLTGSLWFKACPGPPCLATLPFSIWLIFRLLGFYKSSIDKADLLRGYNEICVSQKGFINIHNAKIWGEKMQIYSSAQAV